MAMASSNAENLFFSSAADILEIDGADGSVKFRETPDWSSLKAFALLVMMENSFSAPVGMDEFAEMSTLGDLYRRAVKALVARTTMLDISSLGDNPRYGDPPEWDSVNHIRIVMEMESLFGVRYQAQRIPELLSLDERAKQ